MPAKPVTLTLDKERHWLFDGNAMCALADTNIDPAVLADEKVSPMKKFPAVRALLWAGLLHEDPDLTLQQVGAMIDMDNMEDVLKAIGQANPTHPGA